MRKFTFLIAIVATVAILFIAIKPVRAAANAQSKGGAAVAFAKILVATNSVGVKTFGGKGTTTINELVTTPGSADITFGGKYTKDLTTDQVVLIMTTESGEFGVANGQVTSASSTQIVIHVTSFNATTGNPQSQPIFVAVYIGQTF